MTRLRKATIPCPCCDGNFSTDVIFSTIWSGKVSTDLLRFAMGGKMPINFLVYTCPECGWSGQDEHPEPVTEEVRRFVRENITPSLDGDEIPSWRKWEYHALIREAAGCSGIDQGSAFLIAAQCARLGGQFEEEKKYRLRAIGSYIKALDVEDVPGDSLYQTTYLIGELYRRVGDTTKAHEWFKKVGSLGTGYDRREFFTNLAQLQMTSPRNFISEEDERKAAKREKPGLFSKVKKLLGIREVKY